MFNASNDPQFISLRKKARRLFAVGQPILVAEIQRHLRIGYSAALSLKAAMEEDAMDERRNYITRIVETALFFRDMHEEGQDGDTRAIALLKPFKVTNTAIRKYVLGELYGRCGLTLTQAAQQLAAWEHADPRWPAEDVADEVAELCAQHERPLASKGEIECEVERTGRAFVRLARYLRRMMTDDTSQHSRVFEWFIPMAMVPQGHGRSGQDYPEHVVPCIFLRDAAFDLYKRGKTIEQVVGFLRRNLVVVWISSNEANQLDRSVQSGGFGLKTKMPDGWTFEDGCIFERLHAAGIEFYPPAEYACSH